MYSINEKVAWTSASGGFKKKKTGIIIAIVPPATDPRSCIPAGYGFKNHHVAKWRKDESYLVRIEGTKKLYWPVVSDLTSVLDPRDATPVPAQPQP
jgi:hypothetical protein